MSKTLIPILATLATALSGACSRDSAQRSPSTVAAGADTQHPPLAGKAAADSLLVEVQQLDSTIRVDVRYSTANNFTGSPLPGYDAPRVLLRREVARALVRVQARLRTDGLGLLIFDGY